MDADALMISQELEKCDGQCGEQPQNATAVTFHFAPRFRPSVSPLGFAFGTAMLAEPFQLIRRIRL
jgi:hypothetical protein